ncbi:hypothetical protein SCARD494_12339 [Seiridium cardinale]
MHFTAFIAAAAFGAVVSSRVVPSLIVPSVPLPTVILPSVTLPSIPLPSVPLPTVTLPSVTLPSIPLTTVTLPSVTLPSVTLPTVTLPSVTLPTVTLPSVTLPTVTLPSVTLPTVTLPSVTLPSVTLPSVTLPSVTLPTVTLPSVTLPSVTLPTLTLPSVSSPTLPVSTTLPGVQLPTGFSAVVTAIQKLIADFRGATANPTVGFSQVLADIQALYAAVTHFNNGIGSVPNLPDGGSAFADRVLNQVCPGIKHAEAQIQSLPFPISLLKSGLQSVLNSVARAFVNALRGLPSKSNVNTKAAIDCLKTAANPFGGNVVRSGGATIPVEFVA